MSRKRRKDLPVLENIKIDGMAAEGKAFTRVKLSPNAESEIVVFIPFCAKDDIVDIKIDKKKRNFAEGHLVKLHTPGADRIQPKCKHFMICGGCKWQHISYEAQLSCKQQQVEDCLSRIAKIEHPQVSPILGSKNIFGYRNKMEYTFSNKKWRTWEEVNSGEEFTDSNNALGFHIPGAFDKVYHIEECLLQEDLGNKIRNYIYDFAIDNGLDFYDIKNNQGLLRTLMLRLASTGEKMVCLSFGRNDKDAIEGVMNAISEKFPEITSLVYVINTKANDTISDLDIIVYKGKEYIEEEMEGLKFRVNAKSFYQTNSLQAYELYKIARKFAGLDNTERVVADKPLVYDLYTGTGTIANFVAKNAKKVIGIEYVEEAIKDAKINAELNGLDNTDFYAGDMKDILTDEFVAQHGRPDIMIIDPPRAGMHPDVIKVILNASPDVIVYVSCNPATQARDLVELDKDYVITDVQPVDMFPHTHHVENVVRLTRRK